MKNKRQTKMLNVSVRGSLHKSKNLPCQDCAGYKIKGNKAVAVVSDGAGSAKYGKIGAEIIVKTLCDLLVNAKIKNIRQDVEKAISVAREKIVLHRLNKTKSEKNAADFSATLVGAFYDGKQGVIFHIGDGAAVVFSDGNYQKYAVSEPENGAFSCETYFYTMENWKDCLRFTDFSQAESLVLMSDGVTGFVFDDDFCSIRQNFLIPIMQYLNSEKSKTNAYAALKNTLDSQQAQRINPDDKTILWAKFK